MCCSVLLFMAKISNAAMCFSTMDCPANDSVCILNCSEIAVNDFNQSTSYGNCNLSMNVNGIVNQGCHIDECNSSYPQWCVPEIFDDHGVKCCCTDDFCNDDFDLPIENTVLPTPTGVVSTILPTPTSII